MLIKQAYTKLYIIFEIFLLLYGVIVFYCLYADSMLVIIIYYLCTVDIGNINSRPLYGDYSLLKNVFDFSV